MAELRDRLRLWLVVAVLLSLAVFLMVSDRRARVDGTRELPRITGSILDVAVPIQKMVAAPVDLVLDTWNGYVALLDVRDQNASLREQLAALEDSNLQLREALVASGRLQRIAEMREGFDVSMLPAELVGVDSSPWFRSVLIDRGRSNGVGSGMPLISEQGLVGLVAGTSSTASKAMLILDGQSAVDGVVQRSRARGIVRGHGRDNLEFEFVVRGSDVAEGDVVITSGLGGVYPKGLRIGTITAVSEAGSSLLQTATLKPAVDFGRLEQVFVVLRRGLTMEKLYEDEAAKGATETTTRARK